jgi:hypothetical protein
MKVNSSSSTRMLVQAAFNKGYSSSTTRRLVHAAVLRRLVQAAVDEG